ncbi:MAG: hypothetical protein U0176_26830 [Bacteroidia bacterium]
MKRSFYSASWPSRSSPLRPNPSRFQRPKSAAVVTSFKTSHTTLPTYIKPTWYEMKQNGGTKLLYKVSYMNGTQFETFVYNLNGAEVFRQVRLVQHGQC